MQWSKMCLGGSLTRLRQCCRQKPIGRRRLLSSGESAAAATADSSSLIGRRRLQQASSANDGAGPSLQDFLSAATKNPSITGAARKSAKILPEIPPYIHPDMLRYESLFLFNLTKKEDSVF
jgi:hypothetical protein